MMFIAQFPYFLCSHSVIPLALLYVLTHFSLFLCLFSINLGVAWCISCHIVD